MTMVVLRTCIIFILVILTNSCLLYEANADGNATEKINVGVLYNWPPQYLTNEKTGEPEGFAIDVMNRVAKQANLKIHYISYMTWPDILQAAATHEIQLIPNMGITKERSTVYDFTTPYETFNIVIFIRRTTTDIRGRDDLDGKLVGVVKDNVGLAVMKTYGKATLKIIPSLEEALMSLLSGNVDALVYPEPPVKTIVLRSGIHDKIQSIEPPLMEIKRGIAIRKGDAKLYHKIDNAVAEVITANDFRIIYEKWFGRQQPYWNIRRVVITMSILLGLSIGMLLLLRNWSIKKLNRKLLCSIADLEQSRKLLKENEAFINKIQKFSHVGTWRYDVTRDNLTWSEEGYRIAGFGPDESEVTFMDFMAMIHPDDRAQVEQTLARFRNNRQPYHFIYRKIRPDSTIRFVQVTAENIYNDSGKHLMSRGMVHDITEIKEAEYALRQREAELNSIFRAAPIAIGMVSGHRLRWANDYLFEMTGYSGNELIGGELGNLYQAEDEIVNIRSEIYASMETEDIATVETQWKTKQGKIIDIRISGTPLKQNNMEDHFIFTAQNITDQKKFQQRLIDSERNYREIFNTVNDALIIHDTNTGTIIDINSKTTELYGYRSNELKGRTVECLSSEEGPYTTQDASALIRKTIEQGPQLFEWMARNKSGETFWVEVNLKNAAIGGVDCCLAVIRDIRERKAAELELNSYRAHLEELVERRTTEIKAKNTELETFTYSVSHDLKAPLRGIDGYSRLLEEEYAGRLDEEGRLFLENIRHSTKQMHQLIEDLLTYSRMERRDLNPSTLNIRQLIDALIFERKHEIEAKSTQITLDISHDHIVCDRESIRQVLGNFIDNAIKFTADEPEPQIAISVSKSDHRWRFSVTDNGIGFDPKYHDRIFGIFQRLHRSEDFPGTGVGLALVKKAADRMNGKTWAQSRPGQGAVFYLDLPELPIDTV